MRRKLIMCMIVGSVALSGCGSSTGANETPEPTTITTPAPTSAPPTTAEPTQDSEPTAVADRTETLRPDDFEVTESDASMFVDSTDLSFELPLGFTDISTDGDGTIFMYRNEETGQSITFAPVGVASAVSSGQQYVDALNDSGNLGGAEAQYWSDPMFGDTPVRHFEIVGGLPAAIYAFDYGDVAYELTITAPESYLLENLRPYALATTVRQISNSSQDSSESATDGTSDPAPVNSENSNG